MTFTALPGYDGPDFDGGDGYCGGGGGGYYGGAGGTNGGDGYRDEGTGGIGTGGLGSRWDISGLTFNTWNLGAGVGGEVYHQQPYGYGGVLVNGDGPQDSRYQGQGYGGGGCGGVEESGSCVIMGCQA